MIKRCHKCKEEKHAQAFSKNQKRCKACAKAYYDANCESYRAYYKANREKRALIKKAWAAANREKIQLQKRARYEATRVQNREENLARVKLYKRNNPDAVNCINAKRRAQKLQATPPWLTKKDFAQIAEWYKIAKELQWLSEEPLHVDHIIPLQGKDVCGLHVPWNLQILPASENTSKGNRIADHVVKYESTALVIEATGGGL